MEELDAVLSMPNEHMILYLYDISEINFMEEYIVWDTDLSVLFFIISTAGKQWVSVGN